ncbi:winged helix-turn-helix transcriptional regulator [Vagococcus sp. BWB3-3]|uniref:Winged helix-turn-helix transcriptional regulator n=1 Tax=Vagococcus allomyrinae TaxID=2794353 RepID=A0A940PG65_9ENTE|nr:winged helix-turn-helix domain-containing protein [Vagococcus allomyrinae]MBP1044275.1 winged helix-turn-helix transcriptional regulator [Vagococcus allomyrinae]
MNNLEIKKFAQMIADDSKVLMINLLMDGGFHTVNELAKSAQIKPHTASYHLKRMLDENFLTMEKHGRFHYFKLTNQDFAQFFESIGAITPTKPARYLSQHLEMEKMIMARTCYDHLAGKLGVCITQYLLEKNYLNYSGEEVHVTTEGSYFFEKQGIDLLMLKKQKRQFCRMCLDWSERRHHIAGSLGHAIYDLFITKKWIIKSPKSRAVILTQQGLFEINNGWGLDLE